MVVDRFFAWVADATVEQRIRAVGPLVRAWTQAEDGDDERDTLEAALTVVADDAEPAVRRALAEVLSECDDAPRHLLLDLLWDEPSIAEIVAERSEALIDVEWIEAAAGTDDDVRFALARRRRVGPGLATALAEVVDRRGAVALVANAGADIPAAALLRLVDRFGEFADLREALALRAHVPVTVRHRVLEKLAETMANLVVLGRRPTDERAGAATRDAKDRATVALSSTASDAEVVVLVDHLRHTGQLTTRLLLRAVCVGDLRFVEEALAVLAHVPVRRVAALVADGRESSFRALYAKAGMPDRAFPAFAAALEIHRELLRETGGWDGRPGDRARFSRRLVERVLTRITILPRRDADDLVGMLRRFAADAAREQARAVVADRTRVVVPALPPPAAESEIEEAAAVLAVDVDEGAIDAAPEIRVDPSLDRFAAQAPGFVVDVEEEIAEALGEAIAASRIEASPPRTDELDEPIGLFSHVSLDDVPPEWLEDEEEAFDPPVDLDALRDAGLRGELAA